MVGREAGEQRTGIDNGHCSLVSLPKRSLMFLFFFFFPDFFSLTHSDFECECPATAYPVETPPNPVALLCTACPANQVGSKRVLVLCA